MSQPWSYRRPCLSGLPTLAAAAWLSWLGELCILAAMLRARAWHPHFLPATAGVAMLALATIALVVIGLWRLFRGPGRLEAATWVFLGVAPSLFAAGHFLYGLQVGFGRLLILDPPRKLLLPLGESLMDLEARFRYPERTEGETVVMIAAPSPIARDQVAAMDRHVRMLRGRLGGRTTDRKIHWVRGPLLGMSGKAAYGTCLASPAGETGPDGDPLSHLDRHEVAHCVMNTFVMPVEVDPPALFVEGWAEANAGRDRAEVRRQVWHMRRNGETRPLRTLVGPNWYHAHAGPVYPQGAVLVDHILDAYGPDRFLDLYSTCTQETFEADCRRVLGVGVDELDAACRAEIHRAAPHRPTVAEVLGSLKLGPMVPRDDWQAFSREFCDGYEQRARLYEDARVSVEWKWSARGAERSEDGRSRWDWRRSGANRSLVVQDADDGSGTALSATPSSSIKALRRRVDEPWRMEGGLDRADEAYERILAEVEETFPMFVISRPAGFSFEAPELAPQLLVTRLERRREEGGDRVEIRLKAVEEGPGAGVRLAEVVLDADRGLIVLSESEERAQGEVWRMEYKYDAGDPPLLRSRHLTARGPDGRQREVTSTVLDRRFGPVPDREFTPERLLDGAVVQKSPSEEVWKDPPSFADYYPALLYAGGASTGLGLIAGMIGGFRRIPSGSHDPDGELKRAGEG